MGKLLSAMISVFWGERDKEMRWMTTSYYFPVSYIIAMTERTRLRLQAVERVAGLGDYISQHWPGNASGCPVRVGQCGPG